MTIDHSDKFYVLSSDVGLNVHETDDTLTSFAMSSRSGMWGEAMFGSILILGAGVVNTYHIDNGKYILAFDLSNNVSRLPVTLYTVTMTTRAGMWGEVMWGDEDLLGTGNLNSNEG